MLTGGHLGRYFSEFVAAIDDPDDEDTYCCSSMLISSIGECILKKLSGLAAVRHLSWQCGLKQSN